MNERKNKLDSANLTLVFEGELGREAMAHALRKVMQEKNLSVRKAAVLAETGTKDIQRISNSESTIDKSLEVLSKLGCKLQIQITDNEPS